MTQMRSRQHFLDPQILLELMAEGEVHKVRFAGNFSEDPIINIVAKGNSQVFVQVGFLKIFHKYRIEFCIPDSLGENIVIPPMQNIYIKVTNIVHSAAKKCYIIHAELSVTKEGLFREQFIIYKNEKTAISNQNAKSISDEHLTIIIKAQVIGKGKGTPSLKEGVHKIGIIETDDNSDLSDWKGFE